MPAPRDLLDLAGETGQLALSLQFLGKGLATSWEHDGPDAQARAARTALGTLEKVRQDLDALINETHLHSARIALVRALECERRGFLRNLHLGDAAKALDRAGLGEFVPVVAAVRERIGGDEQDLRDLLQELGGEP